MAELVGNIIAFALETLFSAWMLMLAVGVAHAAWIPMLPTIGFEAALDIVSLLNLAAISFWAVLKVVL